MFRLRQFVPSRSSSRVLALSIAYSLAVQAVMASVGLGMSAFAANGSVGFAICSHAAAGAPASGSHRQNPNPLPPCPFCFIASQSAGYIPLVAEAPPFPISGGRSINPVVHSIGDAEFVPQFRRIAGAPRAPPLVSV
jgi:hypothetical protein